MAVSLSFSHRPSRQRKLYNKIPIFILDYPIVHRRNLATKKARAEPCWVRNLEKLTADNIDGDSRQHRG